MLTNSEESSGSESSDHWAHAPLFQFKIRLGGTEGRGAGRCSGQMIGLSCGLCALVLTLLSNALGTRGLASPLERSYDVPVCVEIQLVKRLPVFA